MNKLTRIIGSWIMALAVLIPPFLMGFCMAYKWNSFFSIILSLLVAGEIVAISVLIYAEAENDDY